MLKWIASKRRKTKTIYLWIYYPIGCVKVIIDNKQSHGITANPYGAVHQAAKFQTDI